MDTINNVATAAAKAVWGENGANQEPVSGQQGDTSKGEPYDAGNMDPDDQKRFETTNEEGASTKPSEQPASDEATAKNPAEEPAEVTGAGPKPVAALAKEHGGNAGDTGNTESAPADASDDKAKDGDAKDDDGKDKGTGEEYVKTTGLAADGGDFDATKPGAGREADRLMDEKGIAHDVDTKGPKKDEADSKDAKPSGTGSSSSNSTPKKDKPSLGDRLKAKFKKH